MATGGLLLDVPLESVQGQQETNLGKLLTGRRKVGVYTGGGATRGHCGVGGEDGCVQQDRLLILELCFVS